MTGLYCSVFFFQAEDGIRDIGVTGVQTCALPIFALDDWDHAVQVGFTAGSRRLDIGSIGGPEDSGEVPPGPLTALGVGAGRSGERRVGEEWRSRWAPYHLKKKKHTTFRLCSNNSM